VRTLVSTRAPAAAGITAVRAHLLPAVLCLGAVATVVAPVAWHNATHGAGWTISTNNERNLLAGNNPHTHHYKTSHHAQRNQLEREAQEYWSRFPDESPEVRQRMRDEAVSYMVSHPAITSWRTLSRVRAFWGFDYLMSREIQNVYRFGPVALGALLLVEAGGYLAVMALVLIGVVVARDQLVPGAAALLLAAVVGYQLPYAIAFAAGTYHFPAIWLLMPVAGATAHLVTASPSRLAIGGLARRPAVWAALAAFALVQGEYAYYAILMR
jgi:hypothetical protein